MTLGATNLSHLWLFKACLTLYVHLEFLALLLPCKNAVTQLHDTVKGNNTAHPLKVLK